jgi:hypothetical protein
MTLQTLREFVFSPYASEDRAVGYDAVESSNERLGVMEDLRLLSVLGAQNSESYGSNGRSERDVGVA